MKRKNVIFNKIICICLLVNMIMLTACSNSKQQNKVIENKDKFSNNVNSILSVINDNKSDKTGFIYFNYKFDTSSIEDGIGFKYDISSFDLTDGIISLNSNGDVYLSVESDEFCAIKDFTDKSFTVYDIEEQEKCHRYHVFGNESIKLLLYKNSEQKEFYNPGSINEDYVYMVVGSDMVDSKAVIYNWYRDDVKIASTTDNTYKVRKNKENANYYVEIVTPNGKVINSDVVNILIEK